MGGRDDAQKLSDRRHGLALSLEVRNPWFQLPGPAGSCSSGARIVIEDRTADE